MPTYVALLRGINVGGNNVIPMAALAKSFERAGFTAVRTYIASGNVIFDATAGEPRALEAQLEAALSRAHAYKATVVIRDRDHMLAIAANIPRAWRKPSAEHRYNVVFLRHTIDEPAIVDTLAAKRGLEQVAYTPGALYWSARAADVPKTAMGKLAASKIYREITVRNLNTTLAIAGLMSPK